MKLPCHVVEDLLPLYHDGVCSEESRQLVDEHLHECAACKDVLNTLNEEVSLGDAVEKAQPLLSVKMTWNKEKRKVFVRALAITLGLCLVLLTGWWFLTNWDCVPLTQEDFVVLRLAEFENGSIQIRTTTAYQGFQCDMHYDPEENAIYEVMKRPIIAERKALPDESILYAGMLSDYQGGWGQVSFDPNGSQIWTDENGDVLPVKAFYIGEPGSEDAVLIWEEGMELPPATAEDEAFYQEMTAAQNP